MGLSEILDAMVKKAEEIYAATEMYHSHGKQGYFVAEIKNEKIAGQWDSASRPFGNVTMAPGSEGELIINNGANFEATARGKVAYTRRTGKNSGVNYYQVLGTESWWKGALISKDGKCICAFSGLKGYDDVAIAEAGLAVYEKSMV